MKSNTLQTVYRLLVARYGTQNWWPADSPFEVMVGAILTQSTAWRNVEKAIVNLKAAGALSPATLRKLPLSEVAELVRPSGFYNAKAKKLEAFVQWLGGYCHDDIDILARVETSELRTALLSVYGIGPETADSILLYAVGKPVFVIDAYTKRILKRLGLNPAKDTYEACQALFMTNLPQDGQLFNDYHALLVSLGKDVCKPEPLCRQCYLFDICPNHKTDQE